jgi:hypothetical protein
MLRLGRIWLIIWYYTLVKISWCEGWGGCSRQHAISARKAGRIQAARGKQ